MQNACTFTLKAMQRYEEILKNGQLLDKTYSILACITLKIITMLKLNFRERAILVALVSKFEGGVIEHPLRTIATEIGVSHQTINNYITQFEKYGLLYISNRGTHRQIINLNMEIIKNVLNG